MPIIYKILLIGDSPVGKTSIQKRLIQDTFDDKYRLTNITDFDWIADESKRNVLQIWDTASLRSFVSLPLSAYYKNTDLYILICDLTNAKSLNFLEEIVLSFPINHTFDPPAILVANKLDLTTQRAISDEALQAFCTKHNLWAKPLIVSAKTGENFSNLLMNAFNITRRYRILTTTPSQAIINAKRLLENYKTKRDAHRRFKAETGQYSRVAKIQAADVVISLLSAPCQSEQMFMEALTNTNVLLAITQTGWFGQAKELRKTYQAAQKLCPTLLPSLQELEAKLKTNA